MSENRSPVTPLKDLLLVSGVRVDHSSALNSPFRSPLIASSTPNSTPNPVEGKSVRTGPGIRVGLSRNFKRRNWGLEDKPIQAHNSSGLNAPYKNPMIKNKTLDSTPSPTGGENKRTEMGIRVGLSRNFKPRNWALEDSPKTGDSNQDKKLIQAHNSSGLNAPYKNPMIKNKTLDSTPSPSGCENRRTESGIRVGLSRNFKSRNWCNNKSLKTAVEINKNLDENYGKSVNTPDKPVISSEIKENKSFEETKEGFDSTPKKSAEKRQKRNEDKSVILNDKKKSIENIVSSEKDVPVNVNQDSVVAQDLKKSTNKIDDSEDGEEGCCEAQGIMEGVENEEKLSIFEKTVDSAGNNDEEMKEIKGRRGRKRKIIKAPGDGDGVADEKDIVIYEKHDEENSKDRRDCDKIKPKTIPLDCEDYKQEELIEENVVSKQGIQINKSPVRAEGDAAKRIKELELVVNLTQLDINPLRRRGRPPKTGKSLEHTDEDCPEDFNVSSKPRRVPDREERENSSRRRGRPSKTKSAGNEDDCIVTTYSTKRKSRLPKGNTITNTKKNAESDDDVVLLTDDDDDDDFIVTPKSKKRRSRSSNQQEDVLGKKHRASKLGNGDNPRIVIDDEDGKRSKILKTGATDKYPIICCDEENNVGVAEKNEKSEAAGGYGEKKSNMEVADINNDQESKSLEVEVIACINNEEMSIHPEFAGIFEEEENALKVAGVNSEEGKIKSEDSSREVVGFSSQEENNFGVAEEKNKHLEVVSGFEEKRVSGDRTEEENNLEVADGNKEMKRKIGTTDTSDGEEVADFLTEEKDGSIGITVTEFADAFGNQVNKHRSSIIERIDFDASTMLVNDDDDFAESPGVKVMRKRNKTKGRFRRIRTGSSDGNGSDKNEDVGELTAVEEIKATDLNLKKGMDVSTKYGGAQLVNDDDDFAESPGVKVMRKRNKTKGRFRRIRTSSSDGNGSDKNEDVGKLAAVEEIKATDLNLKKGTCRRLMPSKEERAGGSNEGKRPMKKFNSNNSFSSTGSGSGKVVKTFKRRSLSLKKSVSSTTLTDDDVESESSDGSGKLSQEVTECEVILTQIPVEKLLSTVDEVSSTPGYSKDTTIMENDGIKRLEELNAFDDDYDDLGDFQTPVKKQKRSSLAKRKSVNSFSKNASQNLEITSSKEESLNITHTPIESMSCNEGQIDEKIEIRSNSHEVNSQGVSEDKASMEPNAETDDLDMLREEVYNLEVSVYEKETRVEELKRAMHYKQIHDITDLNRRTEVWKSGCKEALYQLLSKLRENLPTMTMKALLMRLNTPPEFLDFDEENDCFK